MSSEVIEKKKRSERRLLGGNSLLLLVLLACMMSTAMILSSPPALVKLATMSSTLLNYGYSVITETGICCKENGICVLVWCFSPNTEKIRLCIK
jgi:hypothetical protein